MNQIKFIFTESISKYYKTNRWAENVKPFRDETLIKQLKYSFALDFFEGYSYKWIEVIKNKTYGVEYKCTTLKDKENQYFPDYIDVGKFEYKVKINKNNVVLTIDTKKLLKIIKIHVIKTYKFKGDWKWK